MVYAIIPPHISNFIPVPTKNDKNEPSAACVAEEESFLLTIVSPNNAPINGPSNGPTGHGMNIPTTKPTIAPQLPALLPPNLRVIYGVRKKSTTVTITVTIAQATNAVTLK